jgi:lysophospholipase L1-like esterase
MNFIKTGIVCLGMMMFCVNGEAARSDMNGSFKQVDKLGKDGAVINVVFLGGSLTWGANASDPNVNSWRALMGTYLQDKYPKARVNCYDAAIGGTGSDLGMFRLERDVLSKDPDIVFLEYTVNDDCWKDNQDVLFTYETILRKLIARGTAVEIVLLGVRDNYAQERYDNKLGKRVPCVLTDSKRRIQHLKLVEAYQTAVADTYPVIRAKVENKEIDLEEVYCFEGTHPDSIGYEMFFEVVKDGFNAAIKDGTQCVVPKETVYGNVYDVQTRLCLRDTDLPKGWTVEKTFRTSAWFDGLASRWMEDVAVFDVTKNEAPVPLKIEFEGTFLGVFGEGDKNGLNFQVMIDGEIVNQIFTNSKTGVVTEKDFWDYNKMKIVGRLFVWRRIANDLKPGKHTLEIIPIIPEGTEKGQLRIESICFAK